MKQPIFIILFLAFFSTISGQESEINLPKAIINKDLTAYTISWYTTKNGVKSKTKMNEPSFENPYKITIKSSENTGSIKINNKKTIEDFNLQFSYIYKMVDETENITTYEFLARDDKYIARYFVLDDTNDILLISYSKNENNSETMMYTIAKN